MFFPILIFDHFVTIWAFFWFELASLLMIFVFVLWSRKRAMWTLHHTMLFFFVFFSLSFWNTHSTQRTFVVLS